MRDKIVKCSTSFMALPTRNLVTLLLSTEASTAQRDDARCSPAQYGQRASHTVLTRSSQLSQLCASSLADSQLSWWPLCSIDLVTSHLPTQLSRDFSLLHNQEEIPS